MPDDYTTIQAAIGAASAGDVINIAAGNYTENFVIDKKLTIQGAGSESTGTVITQTTAGAGDTKVGIIQLEASGTDATDPITIKDIRLEPQGMAGISVGRFCEATGQNIAFIDIDNVYIEGTNTNPSTEQERGFYIDLTSTADNFVFTDCVFNNLTYGWYTQKEVSAETSTFSNVTVTNCTFNHNNHKGIYTEKLSDASFTGCTAIDNGYDASVLPSYFQAWSAGFDINLKAGTYSNFTFDNCTIQNNGIGGAWEGTGVTIKARDDGSTYGAHPASASNVTIQNCTITGNERGVRFGEPGKGNLTPT
ncbi:MAG: hypothetical protein C0593_12890, partial [Marinilabiliales bacterium]